MKVHFPQKYKLNKILKPRESFICLSPPDCVRQSADQSNAGGLGYGKYRDFGLNFTATGHRPRHKIKASSSGCKPETNFCDL